MKKSEKTDPAKKDRHKPSKMVRVNGRLASVVDSLAEKNATTATSEVNRAIREMLAREGLWHPPKEPTK